MKLTTLLAFICVTFSLGRTFAQKSYELHANFGLDTFENTLSSDQFSSQVPFTTGQTFNINYYIQNFAAQVEHELSFENSKHNVSVPTALSPNSINYTLLKFNYKYIIHQDSFDYGIGYVFTKTSADKTTPNELLNSIDSHSLGVYLNYLAYHKNDLSFKLKSGLEIPFIKTEQSLTTGFNKISFAANVGYLAKYLLSENWSILQESKYTLNYSSYDGHGQRGTLNANEKSQHIQVLIGAGYDF